MQLAAAAPDRPPRGAAGFHQLVARKGGTHVGWGLPGACEAGRGAVGSHDPQPPSSPSPSHTHLSPALPSLGLCLDVRGYRSRCRRFHVQSFGQVVPLYDQNLPSNLLQTSSVTRPRGRLNERHYNSQSPIAVSTVRLDRTPTLSSVFSRVHSSVTTCQ